jgi:cytochrome c551/c552
LRPFYVHELNLEGIRSAVNSWSLVHPTVYYTLNAIPAGNKLATNEVKTFDSGKVKAAAPSKTAKELVSPDGKGKTTAVSATDAPVTFATIKPLLQKHTCLACHAEDKRLVGPAFKEIAKRKYSNEKIVQLIYNPKPENWPDYATPMAAMPQVPKKDALTIAAYINSLR